MTKASGTMKLVVTIPAHNEEETVAKVIRGIPRKIQGITAIEILVIDDGSTDRTAAMAKQAGAFVIQNPMQRGLAVTFKIGLQEALKRKADIIVNIDADLQYNPTEISNILQPILEGKADMVSGDRQVRSLRHMRFGNKYGNLIGTAVLSLLVGRSIKDASSGFRAYSREAVLKLNVFARHTYVHETLIEAMYKNLRLVEVPVTFMERKGKSRLITNLFSHIKKSLETILLTVMKYKALKIFFTLGGFFLIFGLLIGIRFLYFYLLGKGTGHIQSLVLAAILSIIGVQFIIMGMQSNLINANRELNEEILYWLKQHEE